MRIGDSYYFADRTPAFVDRGAKLVARTNNAEVVRSLVEIASARGWRAVTVTGAPEFRRAVWHAATRLDIRIHGYTATDAERAELGRSSRARCDDPNAVELRGAPHPARQPPTARSRRLTGRLLAHGAAHYKFDPEGRLSYFLKLRSADGERTLWGVDLERALVESESRLQVGDTVTVEGRGAERVKVKMPQRDDTGALVGERVIETRRNRWLIESPVWFEQRAAAAAALREGRQPDADAIARDKGLASAVTALWLGRQFAERRVERVEDRERIVAALRQRLADLLERGEAVAMPMLKVRADAPDRPIDPISGRTPAHVRRRVIREREIPPHIHD